MLEDMKPEDWEEEAKLWAGACKLCNDQLDREVIRRMAAEREVMYLRTLTNNLQKAVEALEATR